jgi:hypothetical protein
MRWSWCPLCTRPTRWVAWIFMVLAHWKNSPRVDISLHSDTLFWFRANQSLPFLVNDAYLAEKQQMPILESLVWPYRGSSPRPTTLEASTLTITPLMLLFVSLAIHEHLRVFRLGSCHLTFHSSLTNGTTAQGVYLLFRPKDLVSRLVGCKCEPWGYSVLDVVGWLVYRQRKKRCQYLI